MTSQRVLQASCLVAAPLADVFEFFSNPKNLNTLTPSWLGFRIESDPVPEMRVGALFDYRLRVRGLPLRWRTEITAWEPGVRFVDVQRKGPYRLWEHEHLFHEVDGNTEVVDLVRYRVPGGPLEPLLSACLVGPDLRRIFAFREARMLEIFGSPKAATPVETR